MIIIVIPTYNERENIKGLIQAIFRMNIPDLNVITVDDNSPDGTADEVEELSQVYPVSLIKRPCKRGIGSAYIVGFKKALSMEADLIAQMDADFSHNPSDLLRMIEAAQTADLVIGSRKIRHGRIEGWNWTRKFMSNGAMWFARFLLGLRAKDVTSGFRIFRRKVLTNINLDAVKSDGYAFQEEMLWLVEKAGYTVKELPVVFVDRKRGASKLNNKDIFEFFSVMLKLKFTRTFAWKK
ncbi:MAG: polyprenol monophosphomannose synthase [bacterium]